MVRHGATQKLLSRVTAINMTKRLDWDLWICAGPNFCRD